MRLAKTSQSFSARGSQRTTNRMCSHTRSRTFSLEDNSVEAKSCCLHHMIAWLPCVGKRVISIQGE